MGDFIFNEDGSAVKSAVSHPVHQMNDLQKKVRDMAMDMYNTSLNGKSDWMEVLSKNYDSYHQVVKEDTTKEEGEKKARISTPDGFSAVEHLLAKERAAIFPANMDEPIIRLLPQNLEAVKFIEPNQSLLNYQFRKMDIRSDIGTIWLRNYLMFGIAPIFPYWRYEERTLPYREPIRIQNPMNGEVYTIGYMAPTERKTVYFNGPDAKITDPEDFYPDPAARAFLPQQMRFAGDLTYMPWERVKMRADLGYYDKDMFNLIGRDSMPPGREDFILNRRGPFRRRDNIEFITSKGMQGMVEIVDIHTKNWIVTVANREIPLRAKKKPYYLGEMCMHCPTRLRQSNEPWGKSVLEPIVPLHNLVNALTNLNLDSVNFAVRKFWTIIRGAVSKEALKNSTGIVEVDDHDDIKEREFKDVAGGVYQTISILLDNMEKATGLNAAANADAANIRSGVQQIAAAEITGERNQMDIDAFLHGGLIPFAHTCHIFNQQFITDDVVVPVVGPNFNTTFITVPLEAIYGDYRFTISAAAKAIPTAVEARQKLELVNSLIPTLMQFPDLLLLLYKQIASDSHYPELAKVLDVVSGLVGNVRQEAGGQLQPGGRQTQNGQGGMGMSGMGGSPTDDMGALLSNIDTNFGEM